MEVIQILAVDEQVEHVVSLSADLETSFHPVELRCLEELRRLELAEERLFGHRLGGTMFELVEDETFEELLVRDANFGDLIRWAMLKIPTNAMMRQNIINIE